MDQNLYTYLIKTRDDISTIANSLNKKPYIPDIDLEFAILELQKAILHIHSKIVSLPSMFIAEKTESIIIDNPNQGQLFNDNGYVVIPQAGSQEALAAQPAGAKPKAKKEKQVEVIQPHALTEEELPIQQHEKPKEALNEEPPAKEELIFMAKEFAKKYSSEKLIEILDNFNVKKISEICLMDNQVIMDFADSIRV
jgi:hypothetical protein